jgi:GTP-binding protein EngB required for normal cell division
LNSVETRIPEIGREVDTAFLSSKMILEGEYTSREIESKIKELKSYKRNMKEEASQRREILLAGESNVGKSSLTNSLTLQNLSDISSRPGKTRKLAFYNFSEDPGLTLVDCPGYGGALGN